MNEVIKEEVEIENFGDFGEINEVGDRGDIGGVVIRKGEGDSVPNGVNFIKAEVVGGVNNRGGVKMNNREDNILKIGFNIEIFINIFKNRGGGGVGENIRDF
jgi:hypothetical protein